MSILDGIVCKLLCSNCQDFCLNIYEDGSKRRSMSNVRYVFLLKTAKHVAAT